MEIPKQQTLSRKVPSIYSRHEWEIKFQVGKDVINSLNVIHPQAVLNIMHRRFLKNWSIVRIKHEFFLDESQN